MQQLTTENLENSADLGAFSVLPEEMIWLIFQLCGPLTVCDLAKVCKYFSTFSKDDQIWQQFVLDNGNKCDKESLKKEVLEQKWLEDKNNQLKHMTKQMEQLDYSPFHLQAIAKLCKELNISKENTSENKIYSYHGW